MKVIEIWDYLILPILIISFLLRAIPRLQLKNVIFPDTYYHLFCAREIRDNKFSVPKYYKKLILKHENTYPYLYHLFLALFPLDIRRWIERFTGAIFDTLSLLVIYFFSKWIIRFYANEDLSYLPVIIAGFYAFAPALLRLGSGPRAYNGSPRVFGQFLYVVHLTSFFYAYSTANYFFWSVSILSGSLIFFSAKFGTQVLLFSGLVFGIVLFPTYFIILLLSCSVAYLITTGRVYKVIKGHILHSVFYVKHLQHINLHHSSAHNKSFRSYLSDVYKNIIHLLRQRNLAALRTFLRWILYEPFFVHLLIFIFTCYLFIPFYLIYNKNVFNSADLFLLTWSLAGLLVFLLTKIKILLFLGEAERYLEYALYPALFIAIKFLMNNNFYLLLIIYFLYCFYAALIYITDYIKQYSSLNTDYPQIENLYNQLNEQEPGIVWPIAWFNWQAAYFSKFPVLTFGSNIDLKLIPVEEFMLVYGNYNWPSDRFEEIVNKYNVSYIISDKSCIDHYLNKILSDPNIFNKSTELILETNTMVCYKIKRLNI
jgi:hypothetical protein